MLYCKDIDIECSYDYKKLSAVLNECYEEADKISLSSWHINERILRDGLILGLYNCPDEEDILPCKMELIGIATGYLDYSTKENKTFELCGFHIIYSYRGKRIQNKLFRFLKKRASEEGATSICMGTTWKVNCIPS